MKANKFYTCCIVSWLFFSAANAQEFKTNESISAQLKNGTVPGTKISSEVAVKKMQDDRESAQKISVPLKQQLLRGTYPGMTVAKTAPASSAPAVQVDNTILASNNKGVVQEASKAVVMPVMQKEGKPGDAPANNKEDIHIVPVQGQQKQ